MGTKTDLDYIENANMHCCHGQEDTICDGTSVYTDAHFSIATRFCAQVFPLDDKGVGLALSSLLRSDSSHVTMYLTRTQAESVRDMLTNLLERKED